ncbi:MAG: NHLP family bacteriocin export ABC transporter permease/ATPase subunit, partial [Clostridiaceae bacterium]|nr:NHLP family bacteriocin export ABC transporter permease/ATPase subunit [Clostridiaceae bacterium]
MSASFNKQLKKRIENDREAFRESFYNLSSIVSRGMKPLKGRADTKEALEEILNYYGAKIISLPENIKDENEQLEYLLKPTGI